jgi:hypothetical protein
MRNYVKITTVVQQTLHSTSELRNFLPVGTATVTFVAHFQSEIGSLLRVRRKNMLQSILNLVTRVFEILAPDWLRGRIPRK